MPAPTPLEQLLDIATPRRYISLGIPAPRGASHRRFTLTPEAVAILADSGIEVRLESGAGQAIHYTDDRYAAAGARITDRATAFGSDIVLHLSPLPTSDVALLRRGALLLTLLNANTVHPQTIEALVRRSVISLALDLVSDKAGNRPFADILDEIDGSAAMTLAAAALADPSSGKGILLGSVPGIVPCEVTVIGASIAGRAAARAALATGATVRIFDDNTYTLRDTLASLPSPVIASVRNPKVLSSALRTADIIIVAESIDTTSQMAEATKAGALIYDLNDGARRAFPTIPVVDISKASEGLPRALSDKNGNTTRTCFINPGAAVPRTCAMAVSNAFVSMVREILTCDGVNNAIKLNPGMQRAVFTFLGRLTNHTLASRCTLKFVDIHILVQLS